MAMNVKFLRGVVAGYNSLAEKNADTLYFCTDGALYLGSNKIANWTDLTDVNNAIKALQEAGYQNASQVSTAISTALAGYYTKEEVESKLSGLGVSALEGRVSTVEGKVSDLESWKNGLPVYVTEEVYNAHLTAQSEKDAAQDKALTDYKAEMVTALEGKEAAGAETRAKAYTDSKFEEANLDQYTTEQEVKDIVDGVIAGAVDGDTITGLANLVEYLNTHGAEAKEMASAIDVLEGKVETIEGKPAYGILSTDIEAWNNEIGAKELAASKATIAEVTTKIESYGYATEADLTLAENRISAIEGKEATWNGKQDALTETQLAAVNSGITAAKVGSYDGIVNSIGDYAKTADIAGSLAKAESAIQEADLAPYAKSADVTVEIGNAVADKATKTELSDGLALKADKATYEAYVESNDDRVDALEAKFEGTDAKVVDVVKAVNMLADGKATTDGAIRNAESNINDIVAQLTWGSF